LIARLRDRNPEVRREAAVAIGRRDAGFDTKGILMVDAYTVRMIKSLSDNLSVNPAVAEALAQGTRDRDPGVRGATEFALGQLNPRAMESERNLRLKPLLKDNDPAVRRRAIGQLRDHPPRDPDAVKCLIDLAVSDSNSEVRSEAWVALRQIDPTLKTAPLADARAKALRKLDIGVRRDIMERLRQSPHDELKASIESLMIALRDTDFVVRCQAAELLGNLARDAEPALEALRDASRNDKNFNVRQAATQNLRAIEQAIAKD